MRSYGRTLPDRRAARLLMLTGGLASERPGASSSQRPAGRTGLAALACVLRAYAPEALLARPAEPHAEAALRGAVRVLCDEARADDPERAEHLLIALKQAWPSLPEVRELSAHAARGALWDRVVALCVEEFYSPWYPHAAAPAAVLSATA
jgi:hypothetical protein